MSSRRPQSRLALGALAILLLCGGGGYLAFRGLFGTAAAPVDVPPPVVMPPAVVVPDVPVALAAVVVATEGLVERRAASGEWVKVSPGEQLVEDDGLRTDPLGRAELAVGNDSLLTVTASTELKIRELSPAVHQLQLKRGRLAARYDVDGKRVLEIEDENGQMVARTKGAKFSILASGQALAVATETGTVLLRAGGAEVEVGAGQQAHSYLGAAPSPVTPIRAEVLLKIARAGRPDPSLCVDIVGMVEPGAEVRLDGEQVRVEADGAFNAQVPRRAGRSSARVSIRDASGRPREQLVPCAREGPSPKVNLNLRWETPDAG